jgi:hypothetical protein
VCIEYSWPHFFTQRGQLPDSNGGWTEWYPQKHVKSDLSRAKGVRSIPRLNEIESRPTLAILTFRWGGQNEIIASQQWGHTGSSVSDIFIHAYLDVVGDRLSTNYEVWTIYIEDKSDMNKIADSAHLIFGASHPLRRAEHVRAMYHLYPTGFEEKCVPTSETGGDGGAALVDQKAFFPHDAIG